MHEKNIDCTIPFFGKIIKLKEFEVEPKVEYGIYADDPIYRSNLKCSYDWIIRSDEHNIMRIEDFIKKVYFNEPYTIVIWADGTKTIVKCSEGCKYDEYTGLATCFLKKFMGDYGFSKFKKLSRSILKGDE